VREQREQDAREVALGAEHARAVGQRGHDVAHVDRHGGADRHVARLDAREPSERRPRGADRAVPAVEAGAAVARLVGGGLDRLDGSARRQAVGGGVQVRALGREQALRGGDAGAIGGCHRRRNVKHLRRSHKCGSR
jgi:hypothetical protein